MKNKWLEMWSWVNIKQCTTTNKDEKYTQKNTKLRPGMSGGPIFV